MVSDGRSQPLFWKMSGSGRPGAADSFHWVAYCIVDQHWKLVSNDDATYVELYDIVADIYEQHDLKDQHPQVVDQLRQQLTTWKSTLPAQPNPQNFSSLRKHPMP